MEVMNSGFMRCVERYSLYAELEQWSVLVFLDSGMIVQNQECTEQKHTADETRKYEGSKKVPICNS